MKTRSSAWVCAISVVNIPGLKHVRFAEKVFAAHARKPTSATGWACLICLAICLAAEGIDMDYKKYIEQKSNADKNHGFDPLFLPDYLFDFQRDLVEWSIRKGRAAIFADCGLGKSVMELVWGENVHRKTGGKVLLLTPLAVGIQMEQEAVKFDISAKRYGHNCDDAHIVVANYEKLHHFKPEDFTGVILDESSILKNFNGKIKHRINIFLRKIKYRLLATATAAPNDFIELGTSSEALGYLGFMDMLGRFFINEQQNCATKKDWRSNVVKWRLKGHAETFFWRWVTSWARAVRNPSDLGYSDEKFILPELNETERRLSISRPPTDMLFSLPAVGLKEVRDERRATIPERCSLVAELINKTNNFAVVWCNLNDEGDLLEKSISDAVQVSGKDSDDSKEKKLIAFSNGESRVLITKPKIGAWGLNWQHCNHVTFFPNYSYEQYYQAVRRCWRFGQKRNVNVDLVYTQGDAHSVGNLRRKKSQADIMFTNLVNEMNNSLNINTESLYEKKVEVPSWA